MKLDNKKISKFLSFVLRHQPESIQLKLDDNGWAKLDDLLPKLKKEFKGIEFDHVKEVVETNDKKRFSFNEDETKIRANQGHSIKVDVELREESPPEVLFHGTVRDFLSNIMKEGLQKMNRQHVHLSKDVTTAKKVGSRRGKPVILKIQAQKMKEEGFMFYLSENGVWLTDEVPSRFINTN